MEAAGKLQPISMQNCRVENGKLKMENGGRNLLDSEKRACTISLISSFLIP
jgi:hypothetical protein